METFHVDHDGTSYYLYSDSETLNEYARAFPLIRLESLFVLEEGEGPHGEPEYYLDVFSETDHGVQPIGQRVIVRSPDQIKVPITEHASDELAGLVINGFPNL